MLVQSKTTRSIISIPEQATAMKIRQTGCRVICLITITCALTRVLAADFKACEAEAKMIAAGKRANALGIDIFYHGRHRGLLTSEKEAPLSLTIEGCLEVCGRGSDPRNAREAFAILTTWVLPAIGLLAQLPYESLSQKKRKNAEAFVNWVGAPASALTASMYSI